MNSKTLKNMNAEEIMDIENNHKVVWDYYAST